MIQVAALFWRALLGIGSFGLVSSTVFLLLAVIAAVRFKGRAEKSRDSILKIARDQLPPVTIFKPVHGMEERLERNLESFFRQDYPDYEIMIGARSADDAAIQLAERVRARHPGVKSR